MPLQSKPNISFLDKSFQEDLTSSYILSVFIHSNSVSFAVYYVSQNKYLGLSCYHSRNDLGVEKTLNQVFDDNKWLSLEFKSVNVILSNSHNTLIPSPLFDGTKIESYLKFNQPVPVNSHVRYDQLRQTLAANVYVVPENLNALLKRYWPSSHIFHSSTVLSESLIINFKNVMHDKVVYVNVSAERFDLLNFKQNKLNLINSFRYKTKEDFIYFLLAALEQLELNPEETEVVLLGDIDNNDALYEVIFKYIRHVSLIERNNTFKYTYVFNELKSHRHYVLLNALLCE